MKIAFASDHAAEEIREETISAIKALGADVIVYGPQGDEKADYPDAAAEALEAFKRGEADRVVLMCGTGIGMSLVANRAPGVRCAVVTDEYGAEMSRRHNNANCIALRSRAIDPDVNRRILKIWLETPFDGDIGAEGADRHKRRILKIHEYDQKWHNAK